MITKTYARGYCNEKLHQTVNKITCRLKFFNAWYFLYLTRIRSVMYQLCLTVINENCKCKSRCKKLKSFNKYPVY